MTHFIQKASLHAAHSAVRFSMKSAFTGLLPAYRSCFNRYAHTRSTSHDEGKDSDERRRRGTAAYFLAAAAAGYTLYELNESVALCGSKELPEYTAAEVAKHKTAAMGIWVTFDGHVYDITKFVQEHPGGADKIILAAGGSVEPFWGIYRIHFDSKAVKEHLEKYRIGRLSAADAAAVASTAASNDPYASDPKRHPALQVLTDKPFNAETPNMFMAENYITPNDLWFVRGHHPVPTVNAKEYTLEVGVEGGKKPSVKLTLDDLKAKFKKHSITATIACAGNRRDEFNEEAKTEGLRWKTGAISTAVWSGARLRDVLAYIGVNDDAAENYELKNVIFSSLDLPFDASIPIEKALSRYGDCILAYEMNGVEIPRDHGYPVRAIVPGTVGARNAKWVHKVMASKEEASGVWQRGVPYRGYSSNVKSFKDVNVTMSPPVQDLPVQSAISTPGFGAMVTPDDTNTVEVKGWAWSGGGRGIVRVEVSADEGKTWTTADITHSPTEEEKRQNRAWAWSLWTAQVPVKSALLHGDKVQFMCKATDHSYNVQPEKTNPLWNLRGILNNAWHRVEVKVDKD